MVVNISQNSQLQFVDIEERAKELNFIISLVKNFFYKRQSNADRNINQNSQFVDFEDSLATRISTVGNDQLYLNRGSSEWLYGNY